MGIKNESNPEVEKAVAVATPLLMDMLDAIAK